jgi:hypothetical protein
MSMTHFCNTEKKGMAIIPEKDIPDWKILTWE